MHYIESEKIKRKPELYTGMNRKMVETTSWILREPFIYEYFDQFDRGTAILEIGCGKGYFLDKLDTMGFQNLYGADLANYLEDKKYRHQAVDLNVEKLGHEDRSLDIVVGFQIIEHLENYFRVLQEATRVLKRGGLFIFSIPNPFNIFYRVRFVLTGNMPGWTLDNNHLLFVTRDVFRKTYLKDFDLIQMFYGKGPIPMLGRLNIIPGVRFPAKTRVLPRCEAFADRMCYFLKKR